MITAAFSSNLMYEPSLRRAPFTERIIKVVNNIDQQQTNSILFLWNDTSQARKDYLSTLYVFLQDEGKKISSSIITSMNNYDVIPVMWSKREKFTKDLVK